MLLSSRCLENRENQTEKVRIQAWAKIAREILSSGVNFILFICLCLHVFPLGFLSAVLVLGLCLAGVVGILLVGRGR
jgi:hypothetical protein